ncbi:MAG: ABC transporter permease [Armatimonadota bacterium]|nr:ABC transporter permease [Armatimonadota bacterium]
MIVLSVFLIASVVTIVDSIDLTVLTIYNYTKAFTPVIPRSGRLRVPPEIRAQVAKMPGVDRTIETSGFFFNVNTVFGQLPFVCFAVTDDERAYLMRRAGVSLESGRMPAPGAPEAVISEGLVRNKKLKLGDTIADPKDSDNVLTVPVPVKLVGTLRGPTWIAFTSKEFVDTALPLVPHSLLATTQDKSAQLPFSDHMYATLDRAKVEVFSFNKLVHQLRTSLASMYLIMHLVNGTVIFVVALMAGMLSNIYFTQRISEFAVLSAIGIRRSILVWHAVSETAILTTLGWIVGVLVNWGAMSLMQGTVFEPRGMLIDPRDLNAYLNTLPIPVFITLFAVATINIRLARLDPVTIIERR